MKITFAMIVYNTDLVLREVLESILPFGDVVVVYGPVAYFQNNHTDEDDTEEILDELEFFNHNMRVIKGRWTEKTEMCQAFMPYVGNPDYLWCIDGDEVFKPEDIEKVIKILETRKPASLGFRSYTFFGGLTRIMGGFEWNHNFKRVLKYTRGCSYVNHRPPTPKPEEGEHIKHAAMMYHYSYCSPIQVRRKIDYYKNADWQGSPDKIKENYFEDVFLAWQKDPKKTEHKYKGVHEFKNIESYTEKFTGEHPNIIKDNLPELRKKIQKQLQKEYLISMMKSDEKSKLY